MSEDASTPERPDPPLETPDLSTVSTKDLLDEVYERVPALLVMIEYQDEGDQYKRYYWTKGQLSTLLGMAMRMKRMVLRECARRDDD